MTGGASAAELYLVFFRIKTLDLGDQGILYVKVAALSPGDPTDVRGIDAKLLRDTRVEPAEQGGSAQKLCVSILCVMVHDIYSIMLERNR